MADHQDPTYDVEYACDSNGDHRAETHECVDSRIKTFACWKAAQSFINECSYVYNLDELLETAPEEDLEIDEREEFNYSLQ